MAAEEKFSTSGPLLIQGPLKLMSIAAANVDIPAAGYVALFADSSNSNKPSQKDSDGNVTELGSGSNSGGGTDWSMIWPANAFPQDINLSKWSNVTGFPEPDYDTYNYPVWNVDYSAAEGLGLFQIEIPTGAANLITSITAQPDDSGATGTNMGWLADICIYRDGSAEGTIFTVDLGATAFNAAGRTTGVYTKALSALTDGTLTVQPGDRLAIALRPNTVVTNPKQADWQVPQVKFEVS